MMSNALWDIHMMYLHYDYRVKTLPSICRCQKKKNKSDNLLRHTYASCEIQMSEAKIT